MNVDVTVEKAHKVSRSDFPVLARKIDGNHINYLDSAATTLKPKPVIDAIVRYYERIGANIHRGKHFLSEEASVEFEEGRYKIARFMGCAGNELVFVKNCTEALNLVSLGLNLTKDDLVLSTMDAHHSNLLPWMHRSNVNFVRTDELGQVDMNHYEELLRHQPKVVALTHCSNVTGIYLPIEQMCKMAKERGALVVIDAAQSVPHQRVLLHTLNADFIACSAHKMVGPTGIGLLCGKQNQLNKLNPCFLGGGMVDWVEPDHFRMRKLPHRLEAGTPPIAEVFGWVAAIQYLENVGFDFVHHHDKRMAELLLTEASDRDYLRIIGAGKSSGRAGLISLVFKDYSNMGDIARMMSDSYGIMCRSGHMCTQPFLKSQSVGEVLRASAYIYNTEEDILDFFSALDEIHRVL